MREISSENVPSGQKNIHLLVVRSENELGYVGHFCTHLIVELSAMRAPEHPV